MVAPRKYPDELRERATRMAVEARQDPEIAVAEYIDWFNNRRLHGELGHVPPAEHEALHAAADPVTAPLETR